MAERLKDRFLTPETVRAMADTVLLAHPGLDRERLVDLVLDDAFADLELKARMRHVTLCLQQVLPKNYGDALDILERAAPDVTGFEAMCLPDFVELHGPRHWKRSLAALTLFTQYSSSEFAIRPLIIADQARAMAYMEGLCSHDNAKVRRFASEGCRPRLPWAMAIPALKKDPRPVLAVLEQLKDDESEDVRRSVANNLNDISKDNPVFALDVCERWKGHSESTDRLIKHACRTLLKAGEARAMRLFGYGDPKKIDVLRLAPEQKKLSIGQKASFRFTLKVATSGEVKVRLEYAVCYVKARGKVSRKVFKISEKTYAPGDYPVTRRHSFADMSTRKHYPGEHRLEVIVNGVVKGHTAVMLTVGDR